MMSHANSFRPQEQYARSGGDLPGRLTFASPVRRVRLKAGWDLRDLYQVSTVSLFPHITVNEANVVVRFIDRPVHSRRSTPEPAAEVILNPAIAWEIEFREEVVELEADLRELQLRSLDIFGEASRFTLHLSRPEKTAYLYIAGSVTNSDIYVPEGVGVRLRVSGGVRDLTLEEDHFESVGGETVLENASFRRGKSRYDMNMAGGVDRLTIHGTG